MFFFVIMVFWQILKREKQKNVSFSPACGVWSALVNGQEAAKERKNGLLVRKVGALVYRYSAAGEVGTLPRYGTIGRLFKLLTYWSPFLLTLFKAGGRKLQMSERKEDTGP